MKFLGALNIFDDRADKFEERIKRLVLFNMCDFNSNKENLDNLHEKIGKFSHVELIDAYFNDNH